MVAGPGLFAAYRQRAERPLGPASVRSGRRSGQPEGQEGGSGRSGRLLPMRAILFAVLAGLCWGVGELCTKAVLNSGRFGPVTILLVRSAGAAFLAAIAYVIAYQHLKAEPQEWWKAGRSDWALVLIGPVLLAGFGGVMCFTLGLKYGDVSVVKPIAFSLAPAVAVLLGWLVLKEPMPWTKALGVALVIAGVILVSGTKGQGIR